LWYETKCKSFQCRQHNFCVIYMYNAKFSAVSMVDVSPVINSHICISYRLSSIPISVKSYRLSTMQGQVDE
jgi:hypothetical protein